MTSQRTAEERVSPDASRSIKDPERLDQRTPAHLVGDMRAAFGDHPSRAVHAKGIIGTGTFTPSEEARSLCRSVLFYAPVPVVVRFSDFTGIPNIPDTDLHGQPRGLAVKFLLPDGSNYDAVSHSFNGFPVATSAQFSELLQAIAGSGPQAHTPTPLDRFLDAHPAARHFLTSQTMPPESFATAAFFGVNAFQFTSPSGLNAFVRYRFMPKAGEHYLDAAALSAKTADYLMDEIVKRVRAAPVEFSWFAQVAENADVIDDPSKPWPEDRRLVKLGMIRIEEVGSHSTEADHALLFLPGTTPPGIAIADPMLAIRNAAYPVSYAQRNVAD